MMKAFFQSLSMFNFALKQKQLTYGLLVWLLTVMVLQPVPAAEIITYYHNDLTGTPVAASDESGNLLWREEYTPYGEQLTQDKKSDSNRRGFTGHVQDRDLGLVYMQARYYDPVLGRFLAYDPAGVNPELPFTFNRYAYGNNNPYGYADPDGELAFLIPAVIWGVGAAMTAYDTYQTYQNEGAAAAAQSLAVDGAITAVSGGVGKLATKAGRSVFKWAKRSPCGCFAAGTLVKTKEGLKPIEEVKLGDLLAAKDEETGEIAWKPVIKQHIYENRPLNTLVLQTSAQNPVELTVTDDHPFWVKGKGWVKSVNLNVGDEVANYETGWHKVVSWTSLNTAGTTYNFDVKDYESYFVSEQLVWVHNGGPCDVKTPHTVNTGGKAPKTSDPNSIIESRRADGSSSATYYDDKGRAFSREDYGQQSTHGSLGQRADGRSVAHEHRFDYNERGFPIKQDVYRELSESGKPVGPWIKKK
ncbi:RHS repeat-associated core domain-containing protein [Zooshikella ganghwensis]|uniref:RHS repeat-associated core domain-containing protein n=1 Tax=Zooshikella ganghwensis TaxID=202772 RepID=UPI0003F75FF4|nr:RHS repeat-associated core domain-containing protein [Zooshikella ganghwensis]